MARRIDQPECAGITCCIDVRRVGAQHHQLAVRHVDDAHHAERDGEANRDQHEHGAETQAEEEHLDAGVEAPRGVDALNGLGRRASNIGVALRRSSPSGEVASSAVRRFRTSGLSRSRSVSRSRRAVSAWSAWSSAASARPVSIAYFTAASVSAARPLTQQLKRRLVERSASSRSRQLSRTDGSGFDSANLASVILRNRRRRLLVPIFVRSAGRHSSRPPLAIPDRSAPSRAGSRPRSSR